MSALTRRSRWGGLCQEEPDLLAAAAALAGAHACAGEALDLVLVDGTVAEHGVEAAGLHLRRLPLQIAWGLDVDQLASRDFFALADVDLPSSGVDEGLEPSLERR
jgi:hypothetical protein